MASTLEELRTNILRSDIASIRRGLDNLSLALESPISLDSATGRMRVAVESSASLSVGTVTTITSMTNMGGFALKETLMDESMYNCWAASIGSLVS